MQIDWDRMETGDTDVFDGTRVEIRGWFIALRRDAADYGLLVAEPACCGGAIPGRAANSVEVFLTQPIDATPRMLTLSGQWTRLTDDPSGWRHRLRNARPIADDAAADVAARGRRLFLGAGAALGLVACSAGRFAPYADSAHDADAMSDTKALLAESVTIDVHSHAGRVILSRDPLTGPTRPFTPLARPMRDGGMNVICLAIVADTTATHVAADGKSFEPFRAPAAGEMYAHAQAAFARARALIESQGLRVIDDAAALRAARSGGPAVVIASEGADFLEGRLDRVDEAHRLHGLRHLQLTHYRVNELGDIQTEAPVHGGLTDFGADVVRRCNALGIVVDVAHGTHALVQRAAAVTTKPLVLSHTSLADRPGPRSRQISPAHARLVAGTGGVIGVWPSAGIYASLDAMAAGARRLADVVGADHVALGSDMLGFITTPVFNSYRQLPAYARALLSAGFTRAEVGKVLGGNYLRVFEATLG